MSPRFAGFIVLLVAFRSVALLHEITTDEVISLNILANANSLDSWAKLIRYDNTHLLQTLWSAAIGVQAPLVLHRLLSFSCGVVCSAAIAYTACQGRSFSVATIILSIISLPLFEYSTEARGYGGLLAAAALLNMIMLSEQLRSFPRRWLVIQIIHFVGALSHPTYLCVAFAAAIFQFFHAQCSQNFRTRMRSIALDFGFGITLSALWGVFLWLYGTILGGPTRSYSDLALDAIRLFLSIPLVQSGATQCILAISALSAASYLCYRGSRSIQGKRTLRLFCIQSVLLVTIAAASSHPLLYPRYFIAVYPCFLLLIVQSMEGLVGHSQSRRLSTLAVILLNVTALKSVADFIALGRGEMSPLISVIQSESAGTKKTTWGDHDNRVGDRFDLLTKDSSIMGSYTRYSARQAETAPDWFIEHSLSAFDDSILHPEERTTSMGWRFKRLAISEHRSSSGLSFYLYKRVLDTP
jgi:hypothetical protein